MSIALRKKNAVTMITETAFYLMTGKTAIARSLYPALCFAAGFPMRCFLLTESFLQSFTHRKKNAAAPYAECPLHQSPTMRNIAPIAERKSQESRRRKECEKSEALLRNSGCKCLAYPCFLEAFQLMAGTHT